MSMQANINLELKNKTYSGLLIQKYIIEDENIEDSLSGNSI